jgi:type IV pilus assembly protein PilE
MNNAPRGFTLIELMIVMAIVGLLAAIAYPSYRNSVMRSARAEAKAAMLDNIQWLERNFTMANRYDKDSAGNDLDSTNLPSPQSPKQGTKAYDITLTVNNATPTTFTLTATPTAGGPMANDECGALTINQAGVKGVGGATVDQCWHR